MKEKLENLNLIEKVKDFFKKYTINAVILVVAIIYPKIGIPLFLFNITNVLNKKLGDKEVVIENDKEILNG